MRPKARLIAAVIVLSLTIAACTLSKPLRIFAPAQYGLTCYDDAICVQDPETLAKARALRDNAMRFVQTNLGPIAKQPRVLFCSSKSCFAQFGNPEVAALYFWGTNRLIINDIGWNEAILRHELIHHWQAETFGVLAASTLPRWYIEGMAYTLSKDPRPVIPNPDADSYRTQFRTWVEAGNNWRIPPG